MNKIIKIIALSVACTVPMLVLVWKLLNDQLGANPVEFLEHTTGDWTIYFLFLTLAITPLQTRFKLNWQKLYLPAHLMRRILGLAAFFYALMHLMVYFVFDMSLSIEEAIIDIIDRPFITIGMVAFFLLTLLAVTSNTYSQKKLKRSWKTLHNSIYALTFLGILHYILLVKADLFQPIIYLLIFAILMGLRWKPNATKHRPA